MISGTKPHAKDHLLRANPYDSKLIPDNFERLLSSRHAVCAREGERFSGRSAALMLRVLLFASQAVTNGIPAEQILEIATILAARHGQG